MRSPVVRGLGVITAFTATALAIGFGGARADAATEPTHQHAVRLIIDTDIFSDVDDTGALAIANAAQDNGRVHLLGVMVNTPSKWGAPAVDAINTYYGHGDIPIGTLKPNNDDVRPKNYAQYLAEHFPNSLKSGTRAPDATDLYRRILSREPDQSVTIAAIGFETNLANLLDSPPDRFSRLSGYDLVARKVRLLTVMGGDWNFGHVSAPVEERPMVRAAAVRTINDWPTRLIINNSPGGDAYTGSALFTETPPDNPVRKAYEIYVGYGNDRNSWDPANIFYDVYGTAGMLDLTGDVGSEHVYADGSSAYLERPDKDQNVVVRTSSAETFAQALSDLMVQPPRHRGR